MLLRMLSESGPEQINKDFCNICNHTNDKTIHASPGTAASKHPDTADTYSFNVSKIYLTEKSPFDVFLRVINEGGESYELGGSGKDIQRYAL